MVKLGGGKRVVIHSGIFVENVLPFFTLFVLGSWQLWLAVQSLATLWCGATRITRL